jgi:DNA-directed RNA polymerase specialized sigma24 family protein
MFYRKEAARLRREAVWAERLAARWKSDRVADISEILRSCLSALSRRDRQILQLRLAGCSYLEMAAQTGCSIHIIHKANHSALQVLRRLLGSAERRPCSRKLG